MISKVWIFIGAGIGSALASLAVLYVFNSLRNYFLFRKLKMKVPLDPKEMADPGKVSSLVEKEVEEDERTKLTKFRQFEQLRYIAERERGTQSRDAIIDGIREGVRGEPERGEIQNKDTSSPNRSVELD